MNNAFAFQAKLLGTLDVDDWLPSPDENVYDREFMFPVWIHVTMY